jgi:hypothetical protein
MTIEDALGLEWMRALMRLLGEVHSRGGHEREKLCLRHAVCRS